MKWDEDSDNDENDEMLLSDRRGIKTRSQSRRPPLQHAPQRDQAENVIDMDDDDEEEEEEGEEDDDEEDDQKNKNNKKKNNSLPKSSLLAPFKNNVKSSSADFQSSLLEEMKAEQARRTKMRHLEQVKRQVLLEASQLEHRDSGSGGDAAATSRQNLLQPSQEQQQKPNRRQTLNTPGVTPGKTKYDINDMVDGTTCLYADYDAFDDKKIVKNRVLAIDCYGYQVVGSRPGLIRYHHPLQSACPIVSLFESFHEAMDTLKMCFIDQPKLASQLNSILKQQQRQKQPLMMKIAQLQSFLRKCVIAADNDAIRNAAESMWLSWLYRVAMTGTGRFRGPKISTSPSLQEDRKSLGRLSTMALQVLMSTYKDLVIFSRTRAGMSTLSLRASLALDQFMELLDEYRVRTVVPSANCAESNSTTIVQPTISTLNVDPVYVNHLGLEHVIRYWNYDRISRLEMDHHDELKDPSVRYSRVSTLLVRLSHLLMDDQIHRQLHEGIVRTMTALIEWTMKMAQDYDDNSIEQNTQAFLMETSTLIFKELDQVVGQSPVLVKFEDDTTASLACAYLLEKLMCLTTANTRTSARSSDYISFRHFLLACASSALFDRLEVPAMPSPSSLRLPIYDSSRTDDPGPESPSDFSKTSPSTPPLSSNHSRRRSSSDDGCGNVESPAPMIVLDRCPPVGIEEEAWQALIMSVHVLEHFPTDISSGARGQAVLRAALSVFRVGMTWLFNSIHPTSSSRTSSSSSNCSSTIPTSSASANLTIVSAESSCDTNEMAYLTSNSKYIVHSSKNGMKGEYGNEEQATTVLALLERFSQALMKVGSFLSSHSRMNEYFRHADLQLSHLTAYLNQYIVPRCAQQAGQVYKPILLQQQDVRKYFAVQSP